MNQKDPNAIDVYVGHRIRLFRTQVGMSQEKLAARLEITFQQVQKYEKGSNRVSASKLYAIARALDRTPADFFEGIPEDGQLMADLPSPQLSKQGIELALVYEHATPMQRQAIRSMIDAFGGVPATGGVHA